MYLVLSEPSVGEVAHSAEFAGGDRLRWMTESERASRLHLDKHEGRTLASDNVDLTLRAPPIALNDRDAEALEMPRRYLFAVLT